MILDLLLSSDNKIWFFLKERFAENPEAISIGGNKNVSRRYWEFYSAKSDKYLFQFKKKENG